MLINFLQYFKYFSLQVASAVILGVSVWSMLDHSEFHDLLDLSTVDYDLKVLSKGPILLICASAILMLVTFLGCFGALKDSKVSSMRNPLKNDSILIMN
jgi:hypothetical protein